MGAVDKNTYRIKLKKLIDIYGMERVKAAIASLSTQSKEVLNMHLGVGQSPMSIPQIAEKLNKKSVKQIIYHAMNRIEIILKGEAIDYGYRDRFHDIVKKYGETKVKLIINNLDEQKRLIVSKYFGLNGEKQLNHYEIAKEINLDYKVCYNDIAYFVASLEKKINNQNSGVLRKRFSGLVEEYGIDVVQSTMKKLSPYETKVAKLYFGLDNGICVEYDQLQKKHSVVNPYYYMHRFVQKLESQLKENKRAR